MIRTLIVHYITTFPNKSHETVVLETNSHVLTEIIDFHKLQMADYSWVADARDIPLFILKHRTDWVDGL